MDATAHSDAVEDNDAGSPANQPPLARLQATQHALPSSPSGTPPATQPRRRTWHGDASPTDPHAAVPRRPASALAPLAVQHLTPARQGLTLRPLSICSSYKLYTTAAAPGLLAAAVQGLT
jgi:hypothetical protein